MKNTFETGVRSKVEGMDSEKMVEVLLTEFPEELQERLDAEILDMDAQTASDYLIEKLIGRKRATAEWGINSLPPAIEIVHECPQAVLASLERTTDSPESQVIGQGMNGKVYQSVRQPDACYKVLFLERAQKLSANIVREAVMQYEVSKLLNERTDTAKVPEVFCFVEHEDVLAIMMEKVEGTSLLNVLTKEGSELPLNFDLDDFFKKLETSVREMNEHGYFHRDLTDNAGNVMIDREGHPWIIDFGSAVKSVGSEHDGHTFQLRLKGEKYLGNDAGGVLQLKERVRRYLRTGNKER